MRKLLVLDNYDSFTYNLVQLLTEIGAAVTVVRNDKITVEEAAAFEMIVLSPGPGVPSEAGVMPRLVERLGPTHPILGVCLGHQCIGEVFGAKLENLRTPVHGKSSSIRVLDPSSTLFSGLPAEIEVGRYHSWIVSRDGFPDSLRITAEDEHGNIMALRHADYRVQGVQFHPESIMTDSGPQMLRSWLECGGAV